MIHHDELPPPKEMQDEDWSWMNRYSTGEAEPEPSDFWPGFFLGFGSCFALACLAVGAVLGVRG